MLTFFPKLGFSTMAMVCVLKQPSIAVFCDFSFWMPSLPFISSESLSPEIIYVQYHVFFLCTWKVTDLLSPALFTFSLNGNTRMFSWSFQN